MRLWGSRWEALAAALLVTCACACSQSPFEEEARGAVPPPRDTSAAVLPEFSGPAPGVLPYAVLGRSVAAAAGPRFDWPASGVRVRLRGTALALVLDESGHDDLAVRVDEGETPQVYTLHTGRNEVRVHLGGGEHVVTVQKRTEARGGHFVVASAVAEQGELLPAPVRPRIEFVGDSISAGFGVEPTGPNGECTFVPREENALGTYAATLARARGADATILAASSKTTREMATFFERAWPSEHAPPFAFGAPPAAVVLLVGTNDFFHREPDQGTFVHDYRTLLARIRAHYGAVPVVATLSPMLSDAYPAGARHRTLGRKYLQAALKKARAAGDQNLYTLELDEPTPEEGLGCSSHPSAATHARMAATLARFFEAEHL